MQTSAGKINDRIQEIVGCNKPDYALVEEAFFGCANQAREDNRGVARMAALLAGLPVEVAGVNAINGAARAVKAGEGDMYIAGEVESMNRSQNEFRSHQPLNTISPRSEVEK